MMRLLVLALALVGFGALAVALGLAQIPAECEDGLSTDCVRAIASGAGGHVMEVVASLDWQGIQDQLDELANENL